MQAKEEGEEGSYGVDTFGLPDEVVGVLPSDPFEQLDVARKITSIALATRVSKLEFESSMLRRKLAEKEDLVDDLRRQPSTALYRLFLQNHLVDAGALSC